MRILRTQKLYLPALTIVALVILLLVIISISTYRNFHRDKMKELAAMRRQGLSLIRSLEAGARASMLMPMWQEDAVVDLIRETARDENIAFIYFADRKGRIVHHSSDNQLEGQPAPWAPEVAAGEDQWRIRLLEEGGTAFEIAKRFAPQLPARYQRHRHGMHQSRFVHAHKDDLIVLGLRMSAYDAARRADLHHAMVMAGILLVLGTGALFFIFVIQNFYLINRTLQSTQDFTRQVINSMANGLLSIDAQGRILAYNQQALEMLGLAGGNVTRTDLGRLLDFKTSGIQATLVQGQAVLDREVILRQPSGASRPLAVSATPLPPDNRGAVILLRDLSQIKRLEEQVRRAERLAAVGKLAAGVAHEIRNPLSSIRGFARFLSHALQHQPEEREYADIMVKEVDRINRVVTDLLSLARQRPLAPTATRLRQLVDHAVRLVQAEASSQQTTIKAVVPSVDQAVNVDVNQLTQALLNLLLNALQALERGGRIEIGAALQEASRQVLLWVEDNGPGISPEDRSRVFDPFYTTRDKGTGLGLAIVHQIVAQHGGSIQLESPPLDKPRGCRFTLYITDQGRPRAAPAEEA